MKEHRYTILIADDEELERKALRLFLESSSLPYASIDEAANGQQVLELCREKQIDIIILDIRMPVLSGLETLEELRSEGNNAKVIISTAFNMFEYAVRALQSGASDFLVKPVDEQIFLQSVAKVMDRLSEEDGKAKQKAFQTEDGSAQETVRQICSYIASNYSKRIGLEEIAADCGYSRFHINKIFRSQMDTTVVDYLIHYRMEKAKELLAHTKESVKNIAMLTGYSDPNYFNWTFRKQTGLSPLQYRADALKEKQKE